MASLISPGPGTRSRAVVVGLDGVPYSLLKSLAEKGCIPNMASIFSHGYFGQMSVTIPDISSISWSSFMTGTQSGEHGIFGFIDVEPGSYKIFFPGFKHLKAPTLWDDLALQGKKTVVINMPATYPAREVNGAMISGFVAIDINKSVYPPSLIPRLKEVGYRIDVDTVKARKDPGFLFQDLDETLKSREQAADLLWDLIDWDLFVVVITGTDRLMHFLWSASENELNPHHQCFLNYFRKVDGFVGRTYERFLGMEGSGEGVNAFCMLSDHGFTQIRTEVYLNHWLMENGFLKFQKSAPQSIMDIGPGSVVFALDPSRFYINLKGKYPLGTVDPADYDRLRLELKQALDSLTFEDGNRVANRIYFKEELYRGAQMDLAPDLVMLPNKGYDLKGRVNSSGVFGRTDLEGMHTQDDAFFYSSNGSRCESIFDAKGIILGSLKSM